MGSECGERMKALFSLLGLIALAVVVWLMRELIMEVLPKGDGLFVWSCYLITAVVMIGNLVAVRLKHGQLKAEITRNARRHNHESA